jgi:hypothetical protein
MIQIIHLSVLVSLFNGKGTFEIHHQQQQCLQIVEIVLLTPRFWYSRLG